MTDGQTLFAVFAAFYLLECLWLVHARAWIAAGTPGSVWHMRRPMGRFQIAGGAPVLLSPLPPFKAHLHTLPWLFVPRANGLAVAQADSAEVGIAWEALALKVEDQTLHLDATTRVRLPGKAAADDWAATLNEWRTGTPERRRAAFLKHARASLDPAGAGKSITQACQQTRMLRLLGEVIFFWCFGVITIVYRWLGESTQTISVIAALPLLTIAQACLFLRATRQHAMGIPHRHWKALGMVFLPHQAARAADVVTLARQHLSHPLAFHEQLNKKDFIAIAQEFWRSARYFPGWKATVELPVEAVALEEFFRTAKLDLTDYDPAPEPGTHAAAWCPRCHAPFLVADTTCQDCGGVELKVRE